MGNEINSASSQGDFTDNRTGDNSQQKKSESSSEGPYINTKKIIVKLTIIGICSMIASVIIGIICVQLLGWGIDKLLNKLNEKDYFVGMSNYVSDFLGGALGLTIGLILDKICIDKINDVYRFKSFMRVIRHEITNDNTKIEKHIKLFKDITTEIQIETVEEFVIDDAVTSTETISVISNLPYSTKFVNEIVDQMIKIHESILEYNTLLKNTSAKYKEYKTIEDKGKAMGESQNNKELVEEYNELLNKCKGKSKTLQKMIEDFLKDTDM